ncbi:hypothetical protein PBY51_008480 [Eleginops maclovinus]|uniref:Uncharacterized protein n=1 Tax=Eleginops maclovinus TaxID=56733 RepID=A0AAN8ABE8_ELEMC|nr:hypothetical protein PBY51_008480 [Eleginops maclovinus]
MILFRQNPPFHGLVVQKAPVHGLAHSTPLNNSQMMMTPFHPHQQHNSSQTMIVNISHLNLVGGSNPGECVRRVLRSVASNFVWSSYNVRGKKGKLPLLGTAVGSTMKRSDGTAGGRSPKWKFPIILK